MFAAFAAALLLGLASRHWPAAMPACLGKYPGDALWALMVFFGWSVLAPRVTLGRIAALATTTCLLVETCKLWQAPWLVELRHDRVGHLFLGHAFSWRNLVAYGAGVLAGVVLERWAWAAFHRLRRPARSRSSAGAR